MKKTIFINQWLDLKPYTKQTITDTYYLKLANRIKGIILNHKHYFVLLMYLDDSEIDVLSCFLVSYFEDVISESNIWNSFVNYHTKLYNKKLPFYDTDGYYEGEINEQDIIFLLWYFFNTIQEEKFISPYNEFIEDIASDVMLTLEKEYEYAPENTNLKSFYSIDEDETDFYVVRSVIDNILFKTYLFYPDTALKLNDEADELIEEKHEDLHVFLNESRDNAVNNSYTRLLGLTGNEWIVTVLGEKHPLKNDLLEISQKISGYFFYKGQDDTDIKLEHIASGKKFDLTKKSYDYSSQLSVIDSILYIGIVKWQNEWWFSGVNFQTDFNADIVLDEKKSLESRRKVDFLDFDSKSVESYLKEQYDSFLNFNNGSPIAFLPSNKIEIFFEAFIEYHNKSLNLSAKQKKKAKERLRKDGYFGDEDNKKLDLSGMADTGLLFFNQKSGGEIAMGINNAFPLKNNPYYNKEDNDDAIMQLLVSESMSTELVMYCIGNCKNKLPFFKEGLGLMYLDDLDFLLRFWKNEHYHSKPSITLTSKSEE